LGKRQSMRCFLIAIILLSASYVSVLKSQTIIRKEAITYELKIGSFANSMANNYILVTDTFQNFASSVDYKIKWTGRVELMFNMPFNEKHSANFGIMLKKFRYPQRPCAGLRCGNRDATITTTYFTIPISYQYEIGTNQKTAVAISNGLQLDVSFLNITRNRVLRPVALSYQAALKCYFQIGKTTALVFAPQIDMAIIGYSKKTKGVGLWPISYGVMVGISKPLNLE
jgi:hypothetical protein